jgi:hypothetical protein
MKMKISDAKKRIARQRLIAVAIMAIAALFLACSGLKSIYFALQGDTTALSTLTQALQRLVYAIYERTQFVAWFWEWAPVINTKEPNTAGNFGFLFVVVCGFIGRDIWDSASTLSSRVKKTIKRVEESGWEEELAGQPRPIAGTKPDVLQINIEVGKDDEWFKRPFGLVLLGVAIAVLGQWANLKFGLIKP